MATKKSMFVLFGILSISAWILASVIQAGAETMNYKSYSFVTKQESVPVGDVDGHIMTFTTRRSICVFENGEVATQSCVITSDRIKESGSSLRYSTMTFSDGSTIIIKEQVTRTGTAGVSTTTASKGEIIKGTGRFKGIKGTVTAKGRSLPVEKDEVGPKGIAEGTITYTLPSK